MKNTYDGIKFTTVIENKTDEKVPIYEGAMLLFVMRPGQTVCLDARDPRAAFAAWEKITFRKDGRTDLCPRKDFILPDLGQFACEVTNVDGKICEEFKVGKHNLFLLRGVPRRVALDIDDEDVVHEEIRLELVDELEEIQKNSLRGYYRHKITLQKICVSRNEKELEAIKKLRDAVGPSQTEKQDDIFAPRTVWGTRPQ